MSHLKHKGSGRPRQRLQEKLDCFTAQKNQLFTVIRDATNPARTAAEEMLMIKDGAAFHEGFMKVMQRLEYHINALTLLTDSAEQLLDPGGSRMSAVTSLQSISESQKEGFPSANTLQVSDITLSPTRGTTVVEVEDKGGTGVIASLTLRPGQVLNVELSFVESPHRLWVQPFGTARNQMMMDMGNHFTSVGLRQNKVLSPFEGMTCVAQFTRDSALYRACVTRVINDGSGKAEVYYLDYGNTELVPVSRLWHLPVQFTTLPAQAICCALAQVAPPTGSVHWSPHIGEQLVRMVGTSVLRCVVCDSSQSPVPIVQLYLPSQGQGNPIMETSVSELLVTKGLALNLVSSSQVNLLSQLYASIARSSQSVGSGDPSHTLDGANGLATGRNTSDIERKTEKTAACQKLDFSLTSHSSVQSLDGMKKLVAKTPQPGDLTKPLPAYAPRNVPRKPCVIKHTKAQRSPPKPDDSPTMIETNVAESVQCSQETKTLKPSSGNEPGHDKLLSEETSPKPDRESPQKPTSSKRKESLVKEAEIKKEPVDCPATDATEQVLVPDKLSVEQEKAKQTEKLSSEKLAQGPQPDITSDSAIPESTQESSMQQADVSGSEKSSEVSAKKEAECPALSPVKKKTEVFSNQFRSPSRGQSLSAGSLYTKPVHDPRDLLLPSQRARNIKRPKKKSTETLKRSQEDVRKENIKSGGVSDKRSQQDGQKEADITPPASQEGEAVSQNKSLEDVSGQENAKKEKPLQTSSKSSAESLREELKRSATNVSGKSAVASHFQHLLKTVKRIVRRDPIEVMLSYIESPSNFAVHCVSGGLSAKGLKLLEDDLKAHFSGRDRAAMADLSSQLEIKVGALCCSVFSQDASFYRAIIMDVQGKSVSEQHRAKPASVLVYYIDFGNSEWLHPSNLFPLPEKFADMKKHPPAAVRCELACITPADCDLLLGQSGNKTSAAWSKGAMRTFELLTGYERHLHMYIVPESSSSVVSEESDDDSPIPVVLVDTSGEEDLCVNAALVDEGYAWLVKPPEEWLDKDVGRRLDEWNPAAEDFLSDRNSYEVEVEDVGVATIGVKVEDERNICKFFGTRRGCHRGERCHLRHVTPDKKSYTQDCTAAYGDVDGDRGMSMTLPEEGSWIGAEVTAIYTPEHFYIVLPWGNKSLMDSADEHHTSDEGYEGSFAIGSKDTLEDLVESMTEHYQRVQFRENKTLLLAEGELVAARYSQDNMWYRARVVRRETDTLVKVFYLDFGNTESIEESQLRRIDPQFLHMPFQAIECYLPGIQPAPPDASWGTEAKRCFTALVDGKTLAVFVSGRCKASASLEVDMYNTSGADDINIGQAMIQAGYAVAAKEKSEEDDTPRKDSKRKDTLILIPG